MIENNENTKTRQLKAIRLPIDTSDLFELTPTLLRFIGFYCTNNFMETDAYRKTWPQKAKTMSSNEIRLEALNVLNMRAVKIAVERFVSATLDPFRDKIEHQILNVLRNQAFYDISDFYYPNGDVKPLDMIDPDKRNAIETILKDLKGKDATEVLVNYKLADKKQAIKMLSDLLKKGAGSDDSQIDDTQRKRVSDIMAGALAGIEVERKRTEEKKAEPVVKTEVVVEDAVVEEPLQIADELEDIRLAVENNPIVKKAKEIINKKVGGTGIGVDDDPLVIRAKEMAKKNMKKAK